MIPVVPPEEMAALDRSAPEPAEVLIGRAGAAVAARAVELMGGAFRRRVVVVAGRGNNGADGRVAAELLAARGADVVVRAAGELGAGEELGAADLVVDAAYGTGLRRAYLPPSVSCRTLAVDIPSGLDGLTGEVPPDGGALSAVATVTFAALKPGLLLGRGPELAGEVTLAGIGLDGLASRAATCWALEDADVARLLPGRPREAHKWQSAVQVVAGSPGMTGAPWLVSRAAMRSGAGYVRLSMPGVLPGALPPGELVHLPVPASGWHAPVLAGLGRFRALVVGPGLGALAGGEQAGGEQAGGEQAGGEVARLLLGAGVPAVVDADGLNAFGSLDNLASVVARRSAPTVVTPHLGELSRLLGRTPGPDRLGEARRAAARSGAVVLFKGSTTVVAAPDGRALIATTGGPRLATAGTGDVLAGMIGAFMARGAPAFEAAGLAAHVHGRAAAGGFAEGLVAGDLPDLVARWLSGVPR